jgi:regulator of PEP synthase PpsR (kinase-PPPase family)
MSTPPIYVVSGGMGTSGEQLVRTALAQFEDGAAPVVVIPRVSREDQITEVVAQAESTGGLVVHTLVDPDLRASLVELARESNIVALDLMGPLLLQLSGLLKQQPQGKPGLYRQLREDYFRRIEAIEFTVAHDDGRYPHELEKADIVVTGLSRVGKTPLSMYLAMQGWKVANVPLVKEIEPPEQLFEIDSSRVVGLTLGPDQLSSHRRRRKQELGVTEKMAYTDPREIFAEVEFAREVFKRGRFATVDITDKPIEETAKEVVACAIRRSQ